MIADDNLEQRGFSDAAAYSRTFFRASIAIFTILAGYFLYLALVLKVNYYDSYEYLNSAKAICGIGGYYDFTRPPIFPLLLTPIPLINKLIVEQWWLVIAPHILMVLLAGLSLYICYRCFRNWLTAEIAVLLTLILAFDRVFFHFVPFVLPDILSTAIVALLIDSIYRVTKFERWVDVIITGLLLALAVSTKHYLAPLCLVPTIFLFAEWYRPESQGKRWQPGLKQLKWLATIALTSAVATFSIHRIVFWIVPEFRSQALFDILRRVLEKGSSVNSMKVAVSASSVLQTIHLIAASIGWPLLIVAILGILIGLRRPTRLTLLVLLWLVTFLLIFIVIFDHREARYFLQVTPAILYFFGLAVKEFLWCWQDRRLKYLAAIAALFVIGFLLKGTIKEVEIFTDPSYQNDAVQRLARQVEEISQPDNKIIWFGDLIAFLPEQANFIDSQYNDQLYYLITSHANGLSYYAQRQAYTVIYPFTIEPVLNSSLKSGDIIVVGQREAVVSPPFPPLGLYRFSDYAIFARDRTVVESSVILKEQKNGSRLLVNQLERGFRLAGNGLLPLFTWELLLKGDQSIPLRGYPISPLPAEVTLPQPVSIDNFQGLITIALDQPVAIFYY